MHCMTFEQGPVGLEGPISFWVSQLNSIVAMNNGFHSIDLFVCPKIKSDFGWPHKPY